MRGKNDRRKGKKKADYYTHWRYIFTAPFFCSKIYFLKLNILAAILVFKQYFWQT